MKYITTYEWRGLKLGVQKSVIEALRVRFKRVPGSLKEIIQSVSDESLLSKLLRKAVTAESLEAFEKIAERIRQSKPKKTARSPYPSFESFIG